MEPISQVSPDLPGRPILQQFWADLTFLHWRVDAAEVVPLLPPEIEPDIFDGTAWVGLIPFRMLHSSFLSGPAIPYFGSFTEVNVRLYGVDQHGRRGVIFASLEASRLAAVLTARTVFGLPYHWAAARFERDGDRLRYSSRRMSRARPSTLVASRASSVPVVGDALADFLSARWRLFVRRGDHTVVQANRHNAWPLFEAELLELDDELLHAAGLPGVALRQPDSVLYSPGVLTQFSLPQRVQRLLPVGHGVEGRGAAGSGWAIPDLNR